MSLPDQTPKLPKLPFLLGDAVLLGAAWFIANRHPGPLTINEIAAVTGCVVFAAIIGAVPFLSDYARKQDEALDERQRGLEALSRTINTAAEQISIAANGLNELTELTHKNLKQAEHLPHKLQEKIAEFNAQLDNARQDDREELEKELVELRTSETERLQTLSEKIHKAIGELSRIEASTQQQLGSRTEQAELARNTFSKTQADATTALTDAFQALTQKLATAQAAALAEIDRKLAARTELAVTAIESAVAKAISGIKSVEVVTVSSSEPTGDANTPKPISTESPQEVASPPKRPRKARREETAPAEVSSIDSELAESPTLSEPTPTASTESTAAPAPPAPTETEPATETAPTPAPFSEPPPVPVHEIAQIHPVAPASAEPFPVSLPPSPAPSSAPPAASTLEPDAAPAAIPPPADAPPSEATERPARKRAARKPEAEPTPDLPLDFADESLSPSDDTPVTSAEMMERVISSDGATRLIATSYIGIGNRLFIRGDGPGLNWEKGVPLQFISIGKWRWETADATAPIQFKLYKNDEVECSSIGTMVLEPGHQQEVTAKF